jgi:hypothetical protein
VAVNHLAGFSLTYFLSDRILAGAPARVVNVVSDAMSNIRPPIFGRPLPVPLPQRSRRRTRTQSGRRIFRLSRLRQGETAGHHLRLRIRRPVARRRRERERRTPRTCQHSHRRRRHAQSAHAIQFTDPPTAADPPARRLGSTSPGHRPGTCHRVRPLLRT